MYDWSTKAGWYYAHVQDNPNLRILHMFEGTFSLDAAQIFWFLTDSIRV